MTTKKKSIKTLLKILKKKLAATKNPPMKSIKLYLDEDIDPLLARVLRERGHDVLTVHEVGKRTLNDRKQLEFAISQGRTFFTHNIKHFVRFSQEYSKSSKNHFGIIVSDHLSL